MKKIEAKPSDHKSTIMNGLQPDPHKKHDLKKTEERANSASAKISKIEAANAEIAYKWMAKFDLMHKEKMIAADTLRKLEVEVIKKSSKISELQSELEKANEVTNQMKALLKSQLKFIDVSAKQQMIMLKQHETIKQYKKQIVRLRIKNKRQKHMTGPIKEDATKAEKAKYSKEDMVQALMAVSKGASLGKASKQFSIPKESLRQAKLRADQANGTKNK